MERTERLLDLVALFLDAREPISWADLREHFREDYGAGSDDAAERKFERDKAELLELGLPISYVQGDDQSRDGYVVDARAYYLPEVGLTATELAVLYAAGSAALASGAFPGSQDLAHALRKIGFFAGQELPTPRVNVELAGVKVPPGEIAARLDRLWAAAAARKFVQLTYYSPGSGKVTSRRVAPYGLALRRGVWSLVAHCHLRGAIRTFQVHRIRELEVNGVKPKTPDFELPDGFKLDDYVASYPWQHRFHEPCEVELSLRGELAAVASRLFPTARVVSSGPEVLAHVEATDLDGLLKYVLSLGPECRVRGPERAVTRWREMLGRIVEAHR